MIAFNISLGQRRETGVRVCNEGFWILRHFDSDSTVYSHPSCPTGLSVSVLSPGSAHLFLPSLSPWDQPWQIPNFHRSHQVTIHFAHQISPALLKSPAMLIIPFLSQPPPQDVHLLDKSQCFFFFQAGVEKKKVHNTWEIATTKPSSPGQLKSFPIVKWSIKFRPSREIDRR